MIYRRFIKTILSVLFLGILLPFNLLSQTNPHGAIDLDCDLCHSPESWGILLPEIKFDHQTTGFFLSGSHVSVGCKDCHTTLIFQDVGTQCYDCHTDIHSNQFGNSCPECHTDQSWIDYEMMRNMHQQTRFPLAGPHEQLDCQSCHADKQYVNLPVDCEGCHYDDYLEITNPIHANVGFTSDCDNCHSMLKFNWAGVQFTHPQSFVLEGGHNIGECDICHTGSIASISNECSSCHLDDYNSTQDPSHTAAMFSLNCLDCHNINAWSPSTFDHNQTDFTLIGAHTVLSCELCHVEGQFADLPSECYDCHQADFESVENPNHVTGQFSHDCLECHTNDVWTPSTFDHNQTNFILTGAHSSISCESCHLNGQFTGTPTDCWSCHSTEYNSVNDPNHVAGQFSQDCLECHTTDAWSPATFNHNQTAFPLEGAHAVVSCELCHIDGQFAGTPTDCWSCHESDYNSVSNPDHAAAQFSHDCTQCHSLQAWTPSTFSHNQTSFPLEGAHAMVSCELCHINGQFAGTPTDCWSCHENDYNSVTDPDHVAGQFNQNCLICHTMNGWIPSILDHNQTAFPLLGAHTTVSCELCHVGGQYAGTPTDCISCHEDDYNSVSDPDHLLGQFSYDCTQCHSMDGWTPATFDHQQTSFPLTGAHVSVSCELCHINGQFSGTPTACYACHQDDYESVSDPDHVQGEFSFDCTECHSTDAWSPATFDHGQTAFPLTGAHVSVSCELCHINGQFSGTPTSCYACHQDDYESVSDPDHVQGEFSFDCTECHSTDAWSPATFDHQQTSFPLTGAHVSVSCELCHINGQFSGTPTECFFCHQDDYLGTTDPNHQLAGFPVNCEICHTTVNWDAFFNHDQQYFPIYSGSHHEAWSTCSDCHPNPTNFLVFTCIVCHEHNQLDMDAAHDEVIGYVYESGACLFCHPNGEKDPIPSSIPQKRKKQKRQ